MPKCPKSVVPVESPKHEARQSVSSDDQPLHSFASRVPNLKRGHESSHAAKALKDRQREAIMKTLDFLLKNPDRALDVGAYVEQVQLRVRAEQEEGEGERFSKHYFRFHRVPPAWWYQWLLQVPFATFTKPFLDKVFKANGHELASVSYCLTGVTPMARLEEPLRCKDICAKTLTALAAERGAQRVAKIMKHTTKGVIDWSSAGPYTVHFSDQGVAVQILHDSGCVAEVSTTSCFTTEWKVQDAFSDALCTVHGPHGNSYALASFFQPGHGPHAVVVDDTRLRECAQDATHKVVAAHKEVQSNMVREEDMGHVDFDPQRRSLLRAREAAKAKRTKTAAVVLRPDDEVP